MSNRKKQDGFDRRGEADRRPVDTAMVKKATVISAVISAFSGCFC